MHVAIINQDNVVIGVTPVSNKIGQHTIQKAVMVNIAKEGEPENLQEQFVPEVVDSIELAKAHLIKCFSTNDYKDGLKDFQRKEDGSMYQLNEVDFVQTSYHENIHYNYAGVGDTWDAESRAFIKPYPDKEVIVSIGKGKLTANISTTPKFILNDRFKWIENPALNTTEQPSLLTRIGNTISNIGSSIYNFFSNLFS